MYVLSGDRHNFRTYAGGIALLVLGCALGLSLPDVDSRFYVLSRLGLVMHRSALTHSFFLPLFLCFQVWSASRSRPHVDPALALRYFTIGLCAALAVHFCFDLFPTNYGWRGFARVHVPLWGWVSPLSSFTWLAGSALVCLYLACRLLRNLPELALGVLALGGCFFLAAAREPHLTFYAPLALVPLAFVAFVLPRPARTFAD